MSKDKGMSMMNYCMFIANEALPGDDGERQKHIVKLLDMKICSAEELEESLIEEALVRCYISQKSPKIHSLEMMIGFVGLPEK